MKFTIITVCYNAQQHIKGTIESVLNQTYTDFQYIIKDGQSLDNTLQIANQLVKDDKRVVVESSSDTGIYDAMNQALLLAEGEYVFFLNAGDVFHDSRVLENTFATSLKINADVLYGDIILKKSTSRKLKKYRNLYRHNLIYLLGDCICHQAMFAKRELFREKEFDTKYMICADRDWQIAFLKAKKKFFPMRFIVADILVDGFSLQNIELFEKEVEECLTRNYSDWSWPYWCVKRFKKHPLVKWMVNRLLTKWGD